MAAEHVTEREPAAATDALTAARDRRAHLHHVIIDLEEANASPAHGRTAEWSARVHDALVEVGAAFERHIAVVEGPGGLFDEVADAAPHLTNALEQLRTEHLDIRARIVAALDAVRLIAGAPNRPSDAGREAVNVLLDRLFRHRQVGADVVYDAYAVDIGTGD